MNSNKQDQPLSLRLRTMRASAWSFGGMFVNTGMRLVGNLIMTRILLPDAFGLMAMVSTLEIALMMITDIGVAQSVVRSARGTDPTYLRVAWTVQAVRGVILASVVVAVSVVFGLVAPHVARPGTVYAEPVLPWLFAMSAVNMVLMGLHSTNQWVAARNMHMGRITLANATTQVVRLLAMVGFAMIDASVWALMAGVIVGSITEVALSHTLFPGPRMRPMWNREIQDELWHFGKWIIGSSLLTFVANQADRIILGGYLNADVFGFYVIAFNLVQAGGLLIDKMTNSISYSALSEVMRERPEDLRGFYGKLSLAIDAMCVAGFVIAVFVGPWFIHTLYRANYATAALFIPVLALSLLPRRYETMRAMILSSGQSLATMKISGLNAVGTCAGLYIGFHVAGIFGALVAVGLYKMAGVPVILREGGRIIGGLLLRDLLWLGLVVVATVLLAMFGSL